LESKGTFFILIIVVAVLALTLAVLAGYIFLVQGNSSNDSKGAAANTAVSTEIPEDKDLGTLELYDSKQYFNLKNDDNSKTIAIIQVNVALQYFLAIKDDKKIKVEEKLTSNQLEIEELISTYFMHVTLDDVKQPDAKEKAKSELKKQINDLLNEGEKKEPHEYVYKVIINQWLYQ
jgi:Flagellar basal body-associated protein